MKPFRSLLVLVPILAILAVASPSLHGQSAPPGQPAHQEAHPAGEVEANPFPTILLALALVLLAVMGGHWAAVRCGQPPVLGELVIGIVVGNLGYALGLPFFTITMRLGEAMPLFNEVWRTGASIPEAAHRLFPPEAFEPGGVGAELLGLMAGPSADLYGNVGFILWAASNLGVVLLLFLVGLESSVPEMLRVGPRALAVAFVGVVFPLVFGYGAGLVLLADHGQVAALFLGAVLTATSVGITARVFNDLGVMKRPEAKVVLGAAVIDDVLGLILLALMVGIVRTGGIQAAELTRIVVASVVFLGLVMALGEWAMRRVAPVFRRLDPPNSRLLFPLALAFLVAWAASLIELSVIVGAYAAGLILSDDHFGAEHDPAHAPRTIHDWVMPLERFLAPVFFVLMGLQVDLGTFRDPSTLLVAAVLTALAIAGKVVSGYAAGRSCDPLTVGLGMMPRGEVGLIFASVGKALGVVDGPVFSAIVLVVMMTTVLAPPALKWSLGRPSMRRRLTLDASSPNP